MWGWLSASMSGLTRIATRTGRPVFPGDRFDPRQLALGLDVDGLQPERHRTFELRWRLANTCKHDVGRAEPRPAGNLDFQIEFASTALPNSRSNRTRASVELALSA